MKKQLFFPLIILLVFGCHKAPSKESSFKESLSNRDLVALDRLVNKFDYMVKNMFEGNLDTLLNKIITKEYLYGKEDMKIICEIINELQNSTLEDKSERMDYDTVFATKNYKTGNESIYSKEMVFVTVTQEGDTSSQAINYLSGAPTIEAKIEKIRNWGYWKLVSKGSFLKALKNSNIEDEVIKKLTEDEHQFYNKNLRSLVQNILDQKIDINDFFVKRILVFSVCSKLMKEEHGC